MCGRFSDRFDNFLTPRLNACVETVVGVSPLITLSETKVYSNTLFFILLLLLFFVLNVTVWFSYLFIYSYLNSRLIHKSGCAART